MLVPGLFAITSQNWDLSGEDVIELVAWYKAVL